MITFLSERRKIQKTALLNYDFCDRVKIINSTFEDVLK